jgi:hypothetical protein
MFEQTLKCQIIMEVTSSILTLDQLVSLSMLKDLSTRFDVWLQTIISPIFIY